MMDQKDKPERNHVGGVSVDLSIGGGGPQKWTCKLML